MLATLTVDRFSDPDWIYERKLDGERCLAFEGNRTSFARLQGRMQVSDPDAARRTGVTVFLYVFDLLHLDGHDLAGLELRQRKALLRRIVRYGGPLRFTPHRVGDGVAYWEQACRRGWEGVIAKRADARYRHALATSLCRWQPSEGRGALGAAAARRSGRVQ